MDKKIRPFLKWPGNKYRCLKYILSNLPKKNRLIEPFVGSGAIFLNANFSNYLLAEINQDLINLFNCLQKNGESFIDYCKTFFININNQSEAYYKLRKEFNACQNFKLRAALFLYLNRHGYNGLCRYNQKGIFNVPFGKYKKPYFPNNEMQYFYQKSQKATFIVSDFKNTFKLAKAGDVIYCDPPYAPLEQQTNFKAYTHKLFTEEDQITLAELAKKSRKKGITVIISNHDTKFTRKYYCDADIIEFKVRRSISCKPYARFLVPELLAIFKP